jgi:hypothetical protein
MANFRGHITTSSLLGVGVGAFGYWYLQYDWGPACLAGGLTAIGGMLPDLDSDSGIPVRELFGLAGVFIPLLLYHRLQSYGLSAEQMLVVLAAMYLVVRYGIAEIFRRITVHRGMFHSVPAMLIAGLAVFVMYRLPDHASADEELRKRLYLSAGVMIGFLSHLVLDEIFAVDLNGLVPKLNQFAGSALKLKSDSWSATLATYAILCVLGYLAWVSTGTASGQWAWEQTITPFKK